MTGDDRSEHKTLFGAFEQTARKYPDQPAFKADGGLGKAYTYEEVASVVKSLASGLAAGDFSAESEVGLLSENRPEWGISYLATTASGKTVVPIDANLKIAEMRYIVENAGLKLIFVSGKFERLLASEFAGVRLLSFEPGSENYWERVFKPESDFSPGRYNEDAVLIYTSGTTGNPKAVRLTHRNLLANMDGVRPALPFGPEDTFLSVLPLHHTFEATCGFLVPLTCGATIVYARSLKSREIREDIGRNKVTVMCGVPLLYEKLYHSILRKIESASLMRRILFRVLFAISSMGWRLGFKWGRTLFRGLRSKGDMGSMRMFVSGGAALPPQINRFFSLIGFDFQQGYGMTECSPVISVNKPDDTRWGSVGPPLGNLEVRINEPDKTGVGEIIVRGDSVTPGYKDQPDKTAELIRDGWLYTGDLGRLKYGHLWITGRRKNLIVSSAGKNIYPEQIEESLLGSKYIMESVVFGRRKKDKQGEDICAIIVPDLEQFKAEFSMPVENPDTELIDRIIKAEVARINGEMADYKRINDIQIQLNELEKTSTKKVKRFVYN